MGVAEFRVKLAARVPTTVTSSNGACWGNSFANDLLNTNHTGVAGAVVKFDFDAALAGGNRVG